MSEDGHATTDEPRAESSDDFSEEREFLATAEDEAAGIEVSEPVRIAWPIIATRVTS